MTSPPLDSTHNRTTSGVESHHRHWAAHTIRLRRAWYENTAFGQHTQSNDVGRGMSSSPLGSTDGRTTSGVACHHSPWTANIVKRCEAWNAIIAFGQHRRSDGVGHCMPSSPLDDKHGRMTSGEACHHHLWATHTVGRCGVWHDITNLGKHTRSATSNVE